MGNVEGPTSMSQHSPVVPYVADESEVHNSASIAGEDT
jgi:hypothetical protein